ncbi:hypothetical protein BG006_000044 [Podila minutissima]|uniref:ArfGap-domain-containing protein n=1 Tax=Podila minutissima TaxID=64525 RepID=A0A9P5ST58_9FUNG|nr:hypothetical protein BG006_000044 [Podila minutissima]
MLCNTSQDTSSGVRFSLSQIQMPSIPGVRHWRRTSTPEKQSTSFWSKFPSFGNSHNSLVLDPQLPIPPAQKTSSSTLPISGQNRDAFEAPPSEKPGSSKSSIISSISSTILLANDAEDGPLFRATVVECENNIRQMKTSTKRIVKAAQAVLEARKVWAIAEESFATELAGFKPAEQLVEKYLHPMAQTLGERSEMLARQMQNLLIEPLCRFQSVDLKAAEVYRKSFDEESKEYYSFLSKYMALKLDNSPQKKAEAEARYEKRRQRFEAKRFEYWVFLLDMRVGGSKGEEIFQHITNYSERHCRNWVEMGHLADEMKPDLDSILSELAVSQEKSAAQRKERQDQRKRLSRMFDEQDISSTDYSFTQMAKITQGSEGEVLDPPTPALYSMSSDSFDGAPSSSNHSTVDLPDTQPKPENKRVLRLSSTPSKLGDASSNIAGIRDLEHQDTDTGTALGRRKEGFLFATSKPNLHNSTVLDKPNSTNWRKYWCVVSEGHLHEYSHWKKGATIAHNEPINLRISTVRACRNQDRRFCFEVITPKFKRVYQATSADDMNSWINVISNAIQGILSGTSSCRNLSLQYANTRESRPSMETLGGNRGELTAGLGGRASMEQMIQAASLPTSLQDRVQPGQAVGRKRGETAALGLNEMGQIISPYSRESTLASMQSDDDRLGTRLLAVMRETSLANNFCADCGAKNPDWCVINLGVLVCIECSGIHRSLGTHISKVRSFTLDTTSYTRDLFDFIRAVGNNVSNQIWEANLNPMSTTLPTSPTNQTSDTTDITAHGKPFIPFRKPVVNDPREYKASFILRKYVDRAFVDRKFPSEIDRPGRTQAIHRNSFAGTNTSSAATRALFQSVLVNNIPAALAAFAAGANLNAVQGTSDNTSRLPSSSYFMNRKEKQPAVPTALDTFGPGSTPNTTRSPILDDSILQPAAATLMESSTDKNSDPKDDIDTLPSSTYNPHTSFTVTQSTPLLIALRHGVPFSLDEQYEVFPLAEFIIQNGATNDLSIEAKLLDEQNAVEEQGNGDGTSTRTGRPDTISRTGSGSKPGTNGASARAVTSNDSRDGATDESWDVSNDSQTTNRRSASQVMGISNTPGQRTSAMNYLRAKSVARGDVSALDPSTQSSKKAASTSMVTHNQSEDQSLSNYSSDLSVNDSTSHPGFGSQRPSSPSNPPPPSRSAALASMLNLSPRLRPQGGYHTVNSTSAPASASSSPGPSSTNSGTSYASTTMASGHPRHPTTGQQDISALFQKRRGSDSGMTGTSGSRLSSGVSKEVKAQYRKSGDFSLLAPISSILSPSFRRQHQSQLLDSDELSGPNFGAMFDNSTGQDSSQDTNSSRAQKVKATLTKSLRLSGISSKRNGGLVNNMAVMMRDDDNNQRRHSMTPEPPVVGPSPSSPALSLPTNILAPLPTLTASQPTKGDGLDPPVRQPSWPDFNTFMSTSVSSPDLAQLASSSSSTSPSRVVNLETPPSRVPRPRPMSGSYLMLDSQRYSHAP